MNPPEKKDNTKPTVKKGVEQPDSINMDAVRSLAKKRKKLPSVAEFVQGIEAGNRVLLGQAITLIESTRQDHQVLAQQIIEKCLLLSKPSIRIGITGTPGVGKSTFIEALGKFLINQSHKVAVLAIDPSSQVSKGSIMGDKTRMQDLSVLDNAFIRPSPAGDSLGGVARKTRETILLCEAAAYDTIIVETVGVGQSETAVHSMVDFFLLLLLPGAGDELQGIKRGIVEMADMAVVNKADGDRISLARQTKRAYQNAMHLYPPKPHQWPAQVLTCSALEGQGISDLWQSIDNFRSKTIENSYFQAHRQDQAKYWLYESIQSKLQKAFSENEAVKSNIQSIEEAVLSGKLSPFVGAEQLLQLFLKQS